MQVFRYSGIRVFRGWDFRLWYRGQNRAAQIRSGLRMRGICAFAAANLWSLPTIAQTEKTAVVPMTTLATRHVVVLVKINGKGPFRLVLDTGSPITFINNRAAKKTGLLDAKAAQSPVMLGMRGQTSTKSFAVGAAKVVNFEVTILDHPVIELLSQVDGPVDGIVGYTFFGHFRTTIDYAAGRVTFTPGKYQPKDIMGSMLTRLMQKGPQTVVQAPAALWGLVVEKPDAEAGVRVAQVYKESAAEAAGLRVGDRILTIDGRWTDSLTETYEALSVVRPGQSAPLVFLRDGKKSEVTVKPSAGL